MSSEENREKRAGDIPFVSRPATAVEMRATARILRKTADDLDRRADEMKPVRLVGEGDT